MKTTRVPDELHRRLKRRAAVLKLPLRRLVEDYLRTGLNASPRGGTEVSTAEVTTAAARGGAFATWARGEEDRYLPTDGNPID